MRWALLTALCLAGPGCAGDVLHRGRDYFDPEVESFHPCGSKSAYWVVGDRAALQPLRERTAALREARRKPYQPIYVEITGEVDTVTTRDGFAKDYEGLFRLREVRRASDEVPKSCTLTKR